MTTRASAGARAAQLSGRTGGHSRTARRSRGRRRGPARSPSRCGRDPAPSTISSRYGSQALALGARAARARRVGGHLRAKLRDLPAESVDTSGEMAGFAGPSPGRPRPRTGNPGGPQIPRDRLAIARRSAAQCDGATSPSRPSARTCCCFCLLQDVAHAGRRTPGPRPRQRLGRRQLIAGFEVSINCRIWVSTEEGSST